jgi:hypothetical protein
MTFHSRGPRRNDEPRWEPPSDDRFTASEAPAKDRRGPGSDHLPRACKGTGADAPAARRLGRFAGDAAGLEPWAFHALEFNAAVGFWAATATNGNSRLVDLGHRPHLLLDQPSQSADRGNAMALVLRHF